MDDVIKDYIYSGRMKEDFAFVQVKRNQKNIFEYTGIIIVNMIPPSLAAIIKDYHNAIDNYLFSILDELEDKIYYYDLQLKKSHQKIHHLSIYNNTISFFIRYPSSNGYLESRPK